MVGHGGSSAGSYLADPTSPIPSHCASIFVASTVRVKTFLARSSESNNPSDMQASLEKKRNFLEADHTMNK